jgi:ribose transport system permease protein
VLQLSTKTIKAAPSSNGSANVFGNILRNYGTLILLGVLIVVFTIATPSFLTASNWANILIVQVVIACMAMGATLVMISGEFDLSLGYQLGFTVMLGGYLSQYEIPAAVVVIAMLLAGTLIGIFNAILTVFFKISSFIATLGVGILLSGLTLGLSGGQVLYSGIPKFITTIGQSTLIGIGVSVWLVIILGIIMFYVLEYTPFGRQLYALGGGERVAFLAGIRTQFMKVVVFALCGLLVGIGSLFQLGQSGAANPGFGPELLLPVYASVFLGVTTFRPGYYNVVGTCVAIIVLAVGFNGLSLLGAPFWVQPVFNGVVLLIAVLSAKSETRKVKIG